MKVPISDPIIEVVMKVNSVVGKVVLLIGRGLDGRAEGRDIGEEGDGEGFGSIRTWKC